MKRILYLANLNPNKFGSMEEHALFLSRELQLRGHVCYLGFISEPEPDIRSRFEEAGAQILTVYCGNTPLVGSRSSVRFREMLALRSMVVRNRIDLVHINFMGLTNPALLGIYMTRAKIVFTEHASGLPLNRGPLKEFLSRCIHAVISRRISKYIGVSNYVRDRFRLTHHVSGDKTVTIYNGVNLERFSPRDQGDSRKSLRLPVGRPIICSVAMLIPEKGIQNLIKATALLVHEHARQDILVLVVGEGHYRSDLEKLAVKLNVTGNIKFLGRRSDVQTIISASDIVVVPSLWQEAFGLIIAEAMASRRPVVASRLGGIPELVESGVSGLLVEPGDVNGMAEAVYGLIMHQDERQYLADMALIKARKLFDLSFQANALVDVFKKVMSS